MDRKEKEKLSLLSFFFQSLYSRSECERNDLDQIWYDVIKKCWHGYFWLLEISGFMNLHYSALNRQQRQHHSVFNSTVKNVLLSQTVFIYYFLTEACLSARARNPRFPDSNSWMSVWSRVQYQRGGLSASTEWGVKVLRLHPAGAHYPLISSSRPEGWCRQEYASLYYVKKKKEEREKKERKKAQFLPAGTENQTHNTETSSWSCFWL